jgi:hypothetical protein
MATLRVTNQLMERDPKPPSSVCSEEHHRPMSNRALHLEERHRPRKGIGRHLKTKKKKKKKSLLKEEREEV